MELDFGQAMISIHLLGLAHFTDGGVRDLGEKGG
jgi:hypothetical protein